MGGWMGGRVDAWAGGQVMGGWVGRGVLGGPAEPPLQQLCDNSVTKLRKAPGTAVSRRRPREHAFVAAAVLPTHSVDALESEIADLWASISQRMARWLDLIADYDARDAAKRHGFRSTSAWLAWRCGVDARTAREYVSVARRLRGLPEVRAALAAKQISYSKARAIARAPETEPVAPLLEMARTSTADEMEKVVSGLRTAESAMLATYRHTRRRRRLDWWTNPDGSLGIMGTLPADDGAALVEAVETAAEGLHEPDGEGEHPDRRPSLPTRRADALVEIARSGAPRTEIVVHVDPEALGCLAADGEAKAGRICALEDGPALPSEVVRRLACDAGVTLVAEGASTGSGLDLGRSRRLVSGSLRAALTRRDRKCQFPGCNRRHGLSAHHIEHWAHGGATDAANLVLLCAYHHRAVHEDGFGLRRNPVNGKLEFWRPDGTLLDDHPPPVRGP